MKMKGKLGIAFLSALAFFGLFYVETQLPFFKKFLPVEENKLVLILLNINLLLILLLFFLITRTFMKAYIERKRGIWGSGLKLKLITTLLFISIIPSFTLFILASGFFQVSMDRWFSQKVEDAIDSAYDAYEVYRSSIYERQTKVTRYLKVLIEKKDLLEQIPSLYATFEEERKKGAYDYYLLLSLEGERIVGNFPKEVEKVLKKKVAEIKEKKDTGLIYTIPEDTGEFYVSSALIFSPPENMRAILFLGDIFPGKASDRLKEMSLFQREFKKARAYKKLLKYGFYIPLCLVTILTVFFSIWVGMKLATAITVPIERVKEGASIIAKGKFDINLEDKTKDEIGTLVAAFNAMAGQLKVAKDEIEEKRRYMEIILDNVATGILTTDRTGSVQLLNRAAKNILGIEGDDWKNKPIKQLLGQDLKPYMRSFLKDIKEAKGKTVTREIKLNLRNRITYVRASITAFFGDTKTPEGLIIAIDDITHILQAERLSLWQEIAKKLTHEIKNPLTPILLSAERLRRKFLKTLSGRERDILNEATAAIINSVQVIKGIVNDLTRLTPYPQAKKEEDLNLLIEEVLQMYRNIVPNVDIRFLKGEVPKIVCDREGIKRAIMNLITNSLKAIENEDGLIKIKTGVEKDKRSLYIEVLDNGKGIPDEHKPKIFDPYFTTEKDGTGLGLAIVNSIVLEHQGSIQVEDNIPRGTKFTIRLPLTGS
jgi:two-component system nitrogen regulation sensor histidine kinase NtrY